MLHPASAITYFYVMARPGCHTTAMPCQRHQMSRPHCTGRDNSSTLLVLDIAGGLTFIRKRDNGLKSLSTTTAKSSYGIWPQTMAQRELCLLLSRSTPTASTVMRPLYKPRSPKLVTGTTDRHSSRLG